MNRQDVLDAAAKCVNGDRDERYGEPENNFERIAHLWNAYMQGKKFISTRDVPAMMALVKIARIAGGKLHADNWVDLAGYAACGGEIESSNK